MRDNRQQQEKRLLHRHPTNTPPSHQHPPLPPTPPTWVLVHFSDTDMVASGFPQSV